jgi:pimeloyl-ACP methyl ester carboxylesterase
VSTKPSLLLLGGMMCDERLWRAQLQHLDDEFAEIVVADLTRSSTIAGMAADALCDAPRRFVLAGLSLGGIVAFECWRRTPERISHLALIDTNPAPEMPERQALRGDEIERARAGELRHMMVDGFKPAYLGSAKRDDPALLDTILDMALALGPVVFERQAIALRDRPDSRGTLPSIDCPTAVVCGQEDLLCPPAYHEYMATRIPDSELTVLPGCGHMAPMEAEVAVSEALCALARR